MFILTGASRKTAGGRALRCVGAPRPPAARLQAPVSDCEIARNSDPLTGGFRVQF